MVCFLFEEGSPCLCSIPNGLHFPRTGFRLFSGNTFEILFRSMQSAALHVPISIPTALNEERKTISPPLKLRDGDIEWCARKDLFTFGRFDHRLSVRCKQLVIFITDSCTELRDFLSRCAVEFSLECNCHRCAGRDS